MTKITNEILQGELERHIEEIQKLFQWKTRVSIVLRNIDVENSTIVVTRETLPELAASILKVQSDIDSV